MMNLMKRNVLGMVVGGIALIGVASPSVLAQDGGKPGKAPAASQPEHKEGKSEGKKQAGAKVGEQAPAFELKDSDGKTVKLEDYKGKIVVLEWFNPECPVVKMHYKAGTMNSTYAKFKDKGVVWLAVNSGAQGKEGAGSEASGQAKKTWKMTHPVLIDESGKVGKSYGAKTTPHMFVIDGKGTLVYAGAIDDGGPAGAGKVNYVEKAIEQTLKGETVTTTTTKPYGCSVKYGAGA
jgi:peroxiredoxin